MIQLDNVRVLDASQQIDEIRTAWLHRGQLHLDKPQHAYPDNTEVRDASGLWLLPAMVDLCARLREPGQQQHGTLASEGHAARANGILHVVQPPDTEPVLERGVLLSGLRDKAWQDGQIHLHIVGALTQGLQGQQPANLGSLKNGGCVAVSNARAPFVHDRVLRHALEYAASLDLTVFCNAQEHELAEAGYVHEGYTASVQGLPGITPLAETVAVSKWLLLAQTIGLRVHFSQLSCAESVKLIRQAKATGLNITADVAMHQLFLNDEATQGFNALAYVLPPLRSESDRQALLEGVLDGTIDAICSQHEPLSATAKLAPFEETLPGISAFDTVWPLACRLVDEYKLPPLRLAELLHDHPAQIIGLSKNARQQGWILVDPNLEWKLAADNMLSQGKNTPFIEQKMRGKVLSLFT